jgi:4-amino-4-deoxy-L-arabinose transferase-like glycosyltransferase
MRARMSRRRGLVLLSLLLVALAVRLVAVAATPDIRLPSDPRDYDRHARSIAAGHGYPPSQVAPAGGPSAIRPPAFPFLVGGTYALTGDSLTAARIVQALLGTLIVALTALIALRIWGWPVAAVAAALGAVFPPLIVDGMTLLTEPLFVVFELSALATVLRWRDTGRLPWLVAAGGLTGLSLLTRPNGALLLIPLALAARRGGSWRVPSAYAAPALALACAALVVLPWTVRNAVELDAFVPVSTQDGFTLIGTYNSTSRAHDGAWIVGAANREAARVVARNRGAGEAELNAELRAEARRFARDHPAYPLEVAAHNTRRLFNLGGKRFQRTVAIGDHGLGTGWADLMTYGLLPFLALALGGLATRAARAAPGWLWSVPVLMLAPVFVLATNRARAPIDPFILMLAALAVTSLTGAIGRRRPGDR